MKKDQWDKNFHHKSLMFDCIRNFTQTYSTQDNWPTLEQFNQHFKNNNLTIKPVEQAGKPEKHDDYYESRIYLNGELQTRTENWHDFFNALVWLAFPEIKKTLNKLHYDISLSREPGSNRNPVENAIALFDECGIIIISDKEELLDLIRNHEWKKLFIEHKEDFKSHLHCITFGHAMYEKALLPYIGMTAHAMLIHSDELSDKNLKPVDQTVAEIWESGKIKNNSRLTSHSGVGHTRLV